MLTKLLYFYFIGTWPSCNQPNSFTWARHWIGQCMLWQLIV